MVIQCSSRWLYSYLYPPPHNHQATAPLLLKGPGNPNQTKVFCKKKRSFLGAAATAAQAAAEYFVSTPPPQLIQLLYMHRVKGRKVIWWVGGWPHFHPPSPPPWPDYPCIHIHHLSIYTSHVDMPRWWLSYWVAIQCSAGGQCWTGISRFETRAILFTDAVVCSQLTAVAKRSQAASFVYIYIYIYLFIY